MTRHKGNRERWVEDRAAVAEQILRVHAAAPNSSIEHLRRSVDAPNDLFRAALDHLVGKRLLSRPKSQALIARENLLTYLVRNGGCALNSDCLQNVLCMNDQQEVTCLLNSLVEQESIVFISDRVFLPPDDSCLNGVIDEIQAPRFSMRDIARAEAVRTYAERVGVAVELLAPVVANKLEQKSKLVRVGDGNYRNKKSVQKVIRRIRALFRAYRPYSMEELSIGSDTDEQTLCHVLADLEKRGGIRKSGNSAFKPTSSLSSGGWPCCECGTQTRSIDAFHDKPLCSGCRGRFPQKYGCITKTRALREFRLREHELYRLTYVQRNNPYYKNASPMQLFLLAHVQELAKAKWGGDEPYLISLTEVSPDQLRWLQEDPERLKQLTPERFEMLLADRFEAMGLCVQLIGRTNEPDGGIDLIAYPDPASNQPKFLLAVQAEHHRTDRKTGAPKVQKFVGAMSAVPAFRLGFVVTNTTFTWTAEEYARNQSHFLRLRSLEDLMRWFRDDFNNEAEWREIPEFVEFGGFRIPILKPKLPRLLSGGPEISAGGIIVPRARIRRTNG